MKIPKDVMIKFSLYIDAKFKNFDKNGDETLDKIGLSGEVSYLKEPLKILIARTIQGEI